MISKTAWQSTHVFVQMDFAEEYKRSDEVQQACWNFTLVNHHLAMIYFK